MANLYVDLLIICIDLMLTARVTCNMIHEYQEGSQTEDGTLGNFTSDNALIAGLPFHLCCHEATN